MKNLFFASLVTLSLAIVSCGQEAATESTTIDSTDTTMVDSTCVSTDSTLVDSSMIVK
jgi:hypothetical protein